MVTKPVPTCRATSGYSHVTQRWTALFGGAALSMLLLALARAGVLHRTQTFHIAPQSIQRALLELGRQANLQIIVSRSISPKTLTSGLNGRMTVEEGLNRLLSDTGLRYMIKDGVVEVQPRAPAATRSKTEDKAADMPKLAARRPDRGSDHHVKRRTRSRHFLPIPPSLRQVIVTGTHISGGAPQSQPIITITRRQIRESGYQSVEQLMDSLPENFNSVGSEQNGFQSDADAGNVGDGASVDLLGLGYASTLVLINGHRLAPAGINAAFTDVSVIPISAIKRIEIVPDGASAIYGADAVGGVVNYILRNHQDGGLTSVEYGSVTHGNLKDYRVAQSYGTNWQSGHALLSYEYHDETPLNVLDRPFSAPSGPGDLTPGLTQNTLYLNATQSVTRTFVVNGSAFYSRRRNTLAVAAGTAAVNGYATTTQYSYALGSVYSNRDKWAVHDHLSIGGNNTDLSSIYGHELGVNRIVTGSIVTEGTLFSMPNGGVRGALGLQARYESLSAEFTGQYTLNNLSKHRTVDSAFLELQLPLWTRQTHAAGSTAATIDIAGRIDHYSDFGTSFNPQAGLAWSPWRGIKIRGTISSSFKAPNFFTLYGEQYALLVNSTDSTLPPGQTEPIMFVHGSNPALTAEKSTEWTGGLDLTPQDVPGLDVNITYYHVRFRNRIADLGIPPFAALEQGGDYAAYIQRNPSLSELEAWASPVHSYVNLTSMPGFGPQGSVADAVAIVDDRYQNVGLTKTSGLLAALSYADRDGALTYHAGLNATYLFAFKNVNVPGERPYSVLNTLDHPVDFRARASAGLGGERWTLVGFLNYINHYDDITTGVPVPVASWTTVDVTGSYRLFTDGRRIRKAQLSISCINCGDRAPPAVQYVGDYLGYDPANSNALGRFVSATLTVKW